jgi:hypothetical protein
MQRTMILVGLVLAGSFGRMRRVRGTGSAPASLRSTRATYRGRFTSHRGRRGSSRGQALVRAPMGLAVLVS